LKKAYFKKAKEYHPDVNKSAGAKEKFAEINEAYETLGDESKKRVYDQTGMTGDEQQQAGGGDPFGGFGGFG
jgi:molecular chaperone DnaJ